MKHTRTNLVLEIYPHNSMLCFIPLDPQQPTNNYVINYRWPFRSVLIKVLFYIVYIHKNTSIASLFYLLAKLMGQKQRETGRKPTECWPLRLLPSTSPNQWLQFLNPFIRLRLCCVSFTHVLVEAVTNKTVNSTFTWTRGSNFSRHYSQSCC